LGASSASRARARLGRGEVLRAERPQLAADAELHHRRGEAVGLLQPRDPRELVRHLPQARELPRVEHALHLPRHEQQVLGAERAGEVRLPGVLPGVPLQQRPRVVVEAQARQQERGADRAGGEAEQQEAAAAAGDPGRHGRSLSFAP